jgi:hypothetical protein
MSTVVHTAQPMKTFLINRFFFIACVTLSIVVLYYILIYSVRVSDIVEGISSLLL